MSRNFKAFIYGLTFVVIAVVALFTMGMYRGDGENGFASLSFKPVSLAHVEVINNNEFTEATFVAMHHDFGISPDKRFYSVLNVVEGRILEDTLKNIFPMVGNKSPYLLSAEIINFNTQSNRITYSSNLSVLYKITETTSNKVILQIQIGNYSENNFNEITNVVTSRQDLIKDNVEKFLYEIRNFNFNKSHK